MSDEQPAEAPAPAADPAPASKLRAKLQEMGAALAAANDRIKVLEADSVTVERDQLLEARTQLEAKLDRMKADHAAAAAAWQTSETMLRRGLTDDEGQAVALTLYGRLPEQDRPELAAWLDGFVSDDGDTTPAALRPYLGRDAPAAPAPSAPLMGKAPAGSPGVLASVPAHVRAAAARGDKEAQETIRAYLASQR
jgi:hypothetical protein